MNFTLWEVASEPKWALRKACWLHLSHATQNPNASFAGLFKAKCAGGRATQPTKPRRQACGRMSKICPLETPHGANSRLKPLRNSQVRRPVLKCVCRARKPYALESTHPAEPDEQKSREIINVFDQLAAAPAWPLGGPLGTIFAAAFPVWCV